MEFVVQFMCLLHAAHNSRAIKFNVFVTDVADIIPGEKQINRHDKLRRQTTRPHSPQS